MWFIPLILLGSWFFAKKAKGDTVSTDGYTKEQVRIMDKIRAEALRQGIPPALALATADLESGFKNVQNSKDARSFGPMQVNTVNLKPGETVAQLMNLDFNIRRGIEILKRYLIMAQGDTYKTRMLYFCGPGLCNHKPPAILATRWKAAAEKWSIPSSYLITN